MFIIKKRTLLPVALTVWLILGCPEPVLPGEGGGEEVPAVIQSRVASGRSASDQGGWIPTLWIGERRVELERVATADGAGLEDAEVHQSLMVGSKLVSVGISGDRPVLWENGKLLFDGKGFSPWLRMRLFDLGNGEYAAGLWVEIDGSNPIRWCYWQNGLKRVEIPAGDSIGDFAFHEGALLLLQHSGDDFKLSNQLTGESLLLGKSSIGLELRLSETGWTVCGAAFEAVSGGSRRYTPCFWDEAGKPVLSDSGASSYLVSRLAFNRKPWELLLYLDSRNSKSEVEILSAGNRVTRMQFDLSSVMLPRWVQSGNEFYLVAVDSPDLTGAVLKNGQEVIAVEQERAALVMDLCFVDEKNVEAIQF